MIPRAWVGVLQGVPADELSQLAVWPDGSAIELEDRDIQISVYGLLTAIKLYRSADNRRQGYLAPPGYPSDR